MGLFQDSSISIRPIRSLRYACPDFIILLSPMLKVRGATRTFFVELFKRCKVSSTFPPALLRRSLCDLSGQARIDTCLSYFILSSLSLSLSDQLHLPSFQIVIHHGTPIPLTDCTIIPHMRAALYTRYNFT